MSTSIQEGTEQEPVVEIRSGENCPFYRSKEQQRDLLEILISDALTEATEEEGLSLSQLLIQTNYHHSGVEPHCCYGEVLVFDRHAGAPAEVQ